MKKLIFSCFLLVVALTLMTGCNTISGMGRDMSAVGTDISKGANTVSRKMSN